MLSQPDVMRRNRDPSHRSLQTEITQASERVVCEVAAYSNTPPEDLPPLYDTIDPDALDALFRTDRMDGRVEFRYGNCNVSVRSDAEIEVTPIDERGR